MFQTFQNCVDTQKMNDIMQWTLKNSSSATSGLQQMMSSRHEKIAVKQIAQEKRKYIMQNVPWFLPEIKTRIAKGILAGMSVTMAVVLIAELQANLDSDSVVYAKTGEAAVQVAEAAETATTGEAEGTQAQLAQVQLDEESMANFDESVAAMQNELASELAEVELEARIAKEIEENRIKLSETDKNVLLRIVEAEATGEDITGKMLVANVILNRVESGQFPDTVEKVVFQKKGSKYQFSPIRDGRYYDVSISEETKEAVERVLNGEDQSQGALYFMSRSQANSSNARWFDNHLTKVLVHGTHEFFK